MEQRTVDSILEWFKTAVSERQAITPSLWVDAALTLNALMGEENSKLAELEHEVAKIEMCYLEEMTAAKSKVFTHATDTYKAYRLQKLKCDNILEYIRLGKKRAQIMSDELRAWKIGVPSNSFSGSKVFFSIPEKAAFIAKRYKSKFYKVLRTGRWKEEDLEEMGYKLRVLIEESQKVRLVVLRRIEYLNYVASLDLDYMRPKWVYLKMKEAQDDYNKLLESLKKNAKKRTKKKDSAKKD